MTLIDTFQKTSNSYVVNFYVKEPKVELKLGFFVDGSPDTNLIGSKKVLKLVEFYILLNNL